MSLLGGVFDDSVDGRLYGIYIDPPDEYGSSSVGFLKGDFSGNVYSQYGAWEAVGSIYRADPWALYPTVAIPAADLGAVTAGNLISGENFARGTVDLYGMTGDFGTFDGLGDPDSSIESTLASGYNRPSTTLAIEEESWGVYSFYLGQNNYFANPQGSDTWSAKLGGRGGFWYFDDVFSDPYFLADITGDAWAGGELHGTLTAKMQSGGSMGYMTGEVLGTYDEAAGDYQAVAVGTWVRESKQFGGGFYGELYKSVYRHRGGFDYANSDFYEYSYNDDDGKAWTRYTYATGAWIDKNYDEDGIVHIYNSATDSWSYDAWVPGTDLSFVSNVPDMGGGDYTTWYEDSTWKRREGEFYGRMGGTESLWRVDGAGAPIPTPVEMIGENVVWNDPVYEPGLWYAAGLNTYNYNNETYTDRDSGSYYGIMGGINIDDVLQGRLLSLYIDPAGNAGYLSADLTGTNYSTFDMFELSGDITREQIRPASDVYIDAADLRDKSWYGSFYYNSKLIGDFTGGGTMDSVHGYAYSTLSINDYDNAASPAHNTPTWGIYGLSLHGPTTGPTTGGWTATLGGEADFGPLAFYTHFEGDFVSDSTSDRYEYEYKDNGSWARTKLVSADGSYTETTYNPDGSTSIFDSSSGWSTGSWDPSSFNPSQFFTPPVVQGVIWNQENSDSWLDGDQGYWLASITDGQLSGQKLTGSVHGKFLTKLKTGSISGDLIGKLNTAEETWEGVSLGGWDGERLAFVSDVPGYGSQIKSTASRYQKQYDSPSESDNSHFLYEYNESNLWGHTHLYMEEDTNSWVDTYFYSDGTKRIYNSLEDSVTYETWSTNPNFTALLAAIDTPPEGYIASSTDPIEGLGYYWKGGFSGILGGTKSITQASAPLTMMGDFNEEALQIGDMDRSVWFSDSYVSSWDYIYDTPTTYDDGAYSGFLAGSRVGTDLDGIFYALYIDANQNAGILKGTATGSFYDEIQMFEAGGIGSTLTPTQKVQNVLLTPQGLTSNVNRGNVNSAYVGADFYGVFEGAGGGNMTGHLADWDSATLSIDDPATQDWGIYRFMLYGEGNSPTSDWAAAFGGKADFNPSVGDEGYWMADVVSGTHNLGKLAGSVAGKYLTLNRMGVLSGNLRGAYQDTGLWTAVAIGDYAGAAASFSGNWGYFDGGGPITSLYYNNGGNMQYAGSDIGLIGFQLKENETNIYKVLAMGTYTDQQQNVPKLWNTRISAQGPGVTGGVEFEGYTGGVWNDTASNDARPDGGVVALTKDTSGNVGIIKGDVDLKVSPGTKMWKAEGEATLTNKETVSDVSGTEVKTGSLNAKLSGGFDTESDSAAWGETISGETKFFAESGEDSLNWGIYNVQLGSGNTFTGKPDEPSTDFTAVLGGPGQFNFSGEDSQNEDGFWLADVTATWGDDGNIRNDNDDGGSNSTGDYLTPTQSGTTEGQFAGLYDEDSENPGDGTWVGQDVGTFEGDTLTYSGNIEGALVNFNGTWLIERNNISGLTGVTDNTLFSGDATKITLMGEFDIGYASPGEPYLLYGSGAHIDGKSITGISPEDGAFKGYMVGVWRNGIIDTKAVSLYIDSNGRAGYLSGNVTGDYFGDLDIWKACGYLTANDMSATGILPLALADSVVTEYFEGNQGTGAFDTGDTITLKAAMGDPMRISDQDWGIWNAGFGGTYNVNTSDTWFLDTGGYYNEDNDHFWIGRMEGTGWNSSDPEVPDITATYSAKALTNDSLYTFTGSILGTVDGGDWQAAGIGTYTVESLLISGNISNGYFLNQDGGDLPVDTGGAINGLFGGTESLWGETAEILAMGSFSNPNNGDLWRIDIPPDAPGASDNCKFMLTAVGIGIDGADSLNPIESAGIGIYVKPDPNSTSDYLTGFLAFNPIAGNAYGNGLDLWQVATELNAIQMGTTGKPLESATIVNSAASNTVNGSLSGAISSEFKGISDQDWGVWTARVGGSGGNPGSGWTAQTGDDAFSRTSIDPETLRTLWVPNPGSLVSVNGNTVNMGIDGDVPAVDDPQTQGLHGASADLGSADGFLVTFSYKLNTYDTPDHDTFSVSTSGSDKAYPDLSLTDPIDDRESNPDLDVGFKWSGTEEVFDEVVETVTRDDVSVMMSNSGDDTHLNVYLDTKTGQEEDDAIIPSWGEITIKDVTKYNVTLPPESDDYYEIATLINDGSDTGTAGVLRAKTAGAWISWKDAVTHVTGGKLVGTFDPANWQAQIAGAYIETSRFMQMVRDGKTDILQKLNIPCFEIGRATLTGGDSVLTSVNMNNVTFFAASTNDPPRIWATDQVSGTYAGAPNRGHAVGLNGDGLNASFVVNKWDAAKWGAMVMGGGKLNRNANAGGGKIDVQFQGGAAGTHGGGNFAGTGAGAVKAP